MKHLFNTSTHLFLLERTLPPNENPHLNKDLGAVVSHLPLNDNPPLYGIPLMSTEDFVVWDYIIYSANHITILFRQKGSDVSENIQYTANIDTLCRFFNYTQLRHIDSFFSEQSRANILDNLTTFINELKSTNNDRK